MKRVKGEAFQSTSYLNQFLSVDMLLSLQRKMLEMEAEAVSRGCKVTDLLGTGCILIEAPYSEAEIRAWKPSLRRLATRLCWRWLPRSLRTRLSRRRLERYYIDSEASSEPEIRVWESNVWKFSCSRRWMPRSLRRRLHRRWKTRMFARMYGANK